MSNVGKRLTQREQVFATHYAGTGDTVYAATKAGIARPAKDGARMLQREDVRNAVALEVGRKLDSLVTVTLNVFAKILADEKAPNKDKIAVGKVVLTAWRGQTDGADAKDPSEMSGDELRSRIVRLQAEAAERARPALELEADEPEDDTGEVGVLG